METRTERVYHRVNGNPGVSTPGGRQKKVEPKPVEKPQPQKVETPKELPKVETPKELPKTGDASTSLGLVAVALMAVGILARPRKRRDE